MGIKRITPVFTIQQSDEEDPHKIKYRLVHFKFSKFVE
jgi:hypothetical protein